MSSLVDGPGRKPGGRTRRAPGHAAPGHVVQFYESEQFLARAVTEYLVAGLRVGEPLVVIASEAHRDAFCQGIASGGVSLREICESGQLLLLDSEETLRAVSKDTSLDPNRFRDVIGGHLQRTNRHSAASTVRVYGEMVADLWARGDHQGAAQLEHLWNDLATEQTFSLLCAYPMKGFSCEAHSELFRDICSAHARVTPTERYSEANRVARGLEISRLQQRAQALEAEVARRRDLESRLRGALVDADMANRAKSEFLAAMSHELRTPLNAIAGYTDLLELEVRGPLTVDQREYVGRIRASQQYLLSLINDLLNFAKLEAGRVEFDLQPVPVDAVCRELEVLIAPLLAERRLSYIYEAGDAAWRLHADPEKVRQIMLNLLGNAVKYTEPGGRIRVSLARATEADAPRTIVIRVADTGIGIAADHLTSIFEPFVQIGRRASEPRDGVGLGLAISRELARHMGGDLTVESTVGVGSTFLLVLPAAS
jgi:signal transduction histidine kinase